MNKNQEIKDVLSSEDEKLIQVATKIIKEHKKAFEVLANG